MYLSTNGIGSRKQSACWQALHQQQAGIIKYILLRHITKAQLRSAEVAHNYRSPCSLHSGKATCGVLRKVNALQINKHICRSVRGDDRCEDKILRNSL